MAMLELITINPFPVEKIDPAGPFAGPLDIKYSTVAVDGRDVRIGETMDFSRADPWSQLAMRAVKALHDEGAFKGDTTILEAGVGDGRNLLQAIGIGQNGGGVDAEWRGRLIGIDIDPRRVALSRANFAALDLASRSDFLEGDAVRRMQDYAARVRAGDAARLSGVAIACLPQAPLDAETHSSADGFDPRLPSFRRVRDMALRGRSVADYGLTLNAAFLLELRDCADDGGALRLLIVVSDRVPRAVVRELFERTGWEEVRAFATPTPVRQVNSHPTIHSTLFSDSPPRLRRRARSVAPASE